MAAAQQSEFAPLTPSTFDSSNITFGKPYDIAEYNFRKVNVGYSHPASTEDGFIVLIKATVLHAAPPSDKCRTHSALLRVTDEETINFINQLDNDVSEAMFKNRKALYDGIDIKGKPALEKIKTHKTLLGYRKKGLLKYSSEYESYSFGITFGTDITIEHSDAIPEEQRNSDTLEGQLAKGTDVVIAANLNSLSINTSTLKWNLKFSATQFGCLSVTQMGGGERAPSDIWGYSLSDLDIAKVVFKDVETNTYGGKSLPVKYAGKGKDTNLTLQFNDVPVFFLKNENTDKKSGKVTTRFSVAIDIANIEKFAELDNAILNHLFKNQEQITDEEPTDDIDIFSDSFNGSLKEREGKHTLWANLYVRDQGGEFDFDGKIFQATGEDEEGKPTFEVMSNDAVMQQLIEGKAKPSANITVYIRYVWLGESYSLKWYMGKAQVFTKAAKKFNLGMLNVARDEEPDEFDGATADLAEPEEVESADNATSEEEED